MSSDWQAKAAAFTVAVRDVEAMVAAAEAKSDFAPKDAVRLSQSTGRIVAAVDGLISVLQHDSADPGFLETLGSLLHALRAAEARAAKLVTQTASPVDAAGPAFAGVSVASTPARPPRPPWFPGRLGDFPGKLSVAGDGAYGMEVVVEPFDQEALEALFGLTTEAGAGQETCCRGELLPEDRNLYDPSAVALYLNGLKVGHLPRDDARRFHETAAGVGVAGQSVDVDVLITRGWRGRRGGAGPYRVRIDASLPFAFGPRQRGMRTA